MNLGNSVRGDWASHQIEHELSGIFDVAHGAGLAVIWPAWAKYILKDAPEKFAKFGYRVLDVEPTGDALADGKAAIEAMEEYYRSIGMPTRLSEMNIFPTEEQIERMAESCTFFGTRTLGGDLRTLYKDDLKAIYYLAK